MTQEHFGPTPADLIVQDFPKVVLLDLTNRCNLSCIHCEQPHMRIQPGYKPRDMNKQVFQKISDEMSQHPESLMRIIGDGEPLMVGELPEMIEYAKKVGVRGIGITTAGFHLDERKSERFLRAGLDFIDFSLDAYSKDTYEKIRFGSKYHRVMSNIHNFLDQRTRIQNKNYRGDRTKVLVNMIDQPAAHDEIGDFFKYWEPLVDRVFVRPLHSVAGLVEVDNPTLREDIPRHPCRYPWERLEVSPDGKVVYCSHAWERPSAEVGDINDQTLAEIWLSPPMQKLRENHLTNSFSKDSLCINCPDWKVLSWDPASSFVFHISEILRQ